MRTAKPWAAWSKTPGIEMTYETPSASDGQTYLQYHVGQLLASAKQYGWEAFRYDAGWLPAKYFPTAKAALAKLTPPVGIGNNLGIIVLGNQPSADWTTYCRNGSLMMEENITFSLLRAYRIRTAAGRTGSPICEKACT